MALVYSEMLPLGIKMPEFSLENTVNGKYFSSDSMSKVKAKVIMFICNHCPYVIHYHDQIIDISNKYCEKLEFVAISSNDAQSYPQDAPDKMAQLAKNLGFCFPYLYDETQEVAKQFKAACTPEFYLFSEDNTLLYRGRLDGSSPGSGKEITGEDLRNAIENFLSGKSISEIQYPSMGCNIKWR